MKKIQATKSRKEEKREKVAKLVKKEAAANKAFASFGGKVTLGKFAMLDESDDDRPVVKTSKGKQEAHHVQQLGIPPATEAKSVKPVVVKTSNSKKAIKSQPKPEKTKNSSFPLFVGGALIGVAVLAGKRYFGF